VHFFRIPREYGRGRDGRSDKQQKREVEEFNSEHSIFCFSFKENAYYDTSCYSHRADIVNSGDPLSQTEPVSKSLHWFSVLLHPQASSRLS
jgi:hypothetical protein